MDSEETTLRSVLVSKEADGASDGSVVSSPSRNDRSKDPIIGPTSTNLDDSRNDRGMVFGGVRVHRISRQRQFLEQLSRYQATQLRVWRCLHGPLDQDDHFGRFVYLFFQVAVILFVVLAVMETEDKFYKHNSNFFDDSAVILAVIITLDWVRLNVNRRHISLYSRVRCEAAILLTAISCFGLSGSVSLECGGE